MVRIVWGVVLILWGLILAISETFAFLLTKSLNVTLPYPPAYLIIFDIVQCLALFIGGSILIYYGDKSRKPPVVVIPPAIPAAPLTRSDW